MEGQQEQSTIKAKWEKRNSQRAGVLKRARDCSELTIPSLLPPQGATESTNLETPYQSLGAKVVNNLASKLLLTLLPPNTPFFRLSVDSEASTEVQDQKAEVDDKLAQIERLITDSIETQALRSPAFEAFKLLIATGNALILKNPKKKDSIESGMEVFRLDQYVIQRDSAGEPLEIIVKETISRKVLPPEIQPYINVEGEDKENKEDLDLFTLVERVDENTWEVKQEINGFIIPKSKGTYKKDTLPWMPLRWTSVKGENYGRGIVEQYLGDLRSLEALEQVIIESAEIMSKVLFLVSPNSNINVKALNKAVSGSFVIGEKNMIDTLTTEKQADLQLAYNSKQDIMQRLSQAFLLNTSITRQAERVTASEINYMAKELEDSLGGVYTILSQSFQRPLVRLLIKELKLDLPPEIIKPVIVTGLEALGRGHDYDKLVMFSQTLQNLFGGELLSQYVNVDVVINLLGSSLGINTNEIIKSQEQLQQEQQQAQLQALAQQGGNALAEEAGKGIGQNIAGTNSNQQQQR